METPRDMYSGNSDSDSSYATYSEMGLLNRSGVKPPSGGYTLRISSGTSDDTVIDAPRKPKKRRKQAQKRPMPVSSPPLGHGSAPNTSNRLVRPPSSRSVDQAATPTIDVGTSNLVSTLIERVEALEKQAQASKRSTKQRIKGQDVSLAIRRETRRVYGSLIGEDRNFEGWSTGSGVTFKSAVNQAILNRLVTEVKTLNPTFLVEHISQAAYRYYLTCSEKNSRKERGKDKQRAVDCRRRERIVRKLAERKLAFVEMVFQHQTTLQAEWSKVLTADLMSSEESGEEEDGDEVLFVHEMPWRATQVRNMFYELDSRQESGKSAMARRQTKRRVASRKASSRPQPSYQMYPPFAWAS